MDQYYTVMLVPEKQSRIRSIRVPRLVFNFLVFAGVALVILISILTYDYVQILQQVYRNKHLSIENRQLKEQIQLFQMKINSLTDDMDRIQTFEKKLRIITGLEASDLTRPILEPDEEAGSGDPHEKIEDNGEEVKTAPKSTQLPNNSRRHNRLDSSDLEKVKDLETVKLNSEFLNLKSLYEQKIATEFGQTKIYTFTKEWSELFKQTFQLAEQYAYFDYVFNMTKAVTKNLELKIHEIDQFLLDKESFLKSTPTLLPSQGWVTSYYGPRRSHYAMRIKMHEGIDIGAKSGRPIVATADGIITFAGEKPGFGNYVQVDHGYGVETIYAHAQKVLVQKGQRVKRGDSIARVGSTGYSTGPHVHYEVRVNDVPVDPLYFILE